MFLGDGETLPVIISSKLSTLEEEKLIRVLKDYKKAIGWTIADLKAISLSTCMHRILLEEIRNESYKSSRFYKEKTKIFHDRMILRKKFSLGQKVLLFHSKLKLFPGKLRSRWVGPFIITNVFPHGTVEIRSPTSNKVFKVNGHRLKPFYKSFR